MAIQTLKCQKRSRVEFDNSLDPNEGAHNEPLLLNLQFPLGPGSKDSSVCF